MRNGFGQPPPPRPVVRLGKLARSALAPGSHGRVLASTSSAIYLMSGGRALLWLANERATLHRRGVQVVGPLPQVEPDATYAVSGRRLDLGQRLAFDLSSASVWDVAPVCHERITSLAPLSVRLVTAFPLLARLPSPSGFGRLLPTILGRIDSSLGPRSIAAPSPSLSRAWPAIRDVLDACQAARLPAALHCAEELVGLGEGLTPSGDDFVGGLLYSFRRLRDIDASQGRLERRELDLFLSRSRRRTNLISYTLLRDHAGGHASAALHQFVDALLFGGPRHRMGALAMQLTAVGHSTGWDLLTGVVVGMMSTCRLHAPSVPGEAPAARLLQP